MKANSTTQKTTTKPRKPKFIIEYGNGGKQKCFTRRDIGDFLAYLAASEGRTVTITPVI